MQYNIIYLASPTFEYAHLWRVVHMHTASDEEKSTTRWSLNASWTLRLAQLSIQQIPSTAPAHNKQGAIAGMYKMYVFR